MEREVSVVHYQSERNKEREGGWDTCFRQQASVVGGGSCTAGVCVLTVWQYRQGTVLRPIGAAGRSRQLLRLGVAALIRAVPCHALYITQRNSWNTQWTSHAASTSTTVPKVHSFHSANSKTELGLDWLTFDTCHVFYPATHRAGKHCPRSNIFIGHIGHVTGQLHCNGALHQPMAACQILTVGHQIS